MDYPACSCACHRPEVYRPHDEGHHACCAKAITRVSDLVDEGHNSDTPPTNTDAYIDVLLFDISNDPRWHSEAHEEAAAEAKAKIARLIALKQREELETSVQQFIFNTKSNPYNFSEYATARLKKLNTIIGSDHE